jgi:hypothetical protein
MWVSGGDGFRWWTRLVVLVAVLSGALHAAPAHAQSISNRGSVTRTAPIYLLPDRSREPLRTAAEGTLLDVLTITGDWVQVRFRDPEFGPRVGFMEARFLELSPASDARPLDLSVASAQRVPQTPAPTSRPPALPGLGREGFWFYGGLGYGSVGCDNCLSLREGGLSGGLTFGGTLSPRVLLGVGTSGFTRTDGYGGRLTVGTLDARLRFYPSSTSGFFLTGGYGLAHFSVSDETRFGAGAIIGAGWDVRVARNVSLTPFYNGFAMRSSLFDANVGQIGLGVTVH